MEVLEVQHCCIAEPRPLFCCIRIRDFLSIFCERPLGGSRENTFFRTVFLALWTGIPKAPFRDTAKALRLGLPSVFSKRLPYVRYFPNHLFSLVLGSRGQNHNVQSRSHSIPGYSHSRVNVSDFDCRRLRNRSKRGSAK